MLVGAEWAECAECAEFGWVREVSGLSASALSQQVGTLGSHGYVEVEKGYVGKRPRTRRHGSTPSKRQAYADRLTDRQRLLLRLQACAASGDTAVRDAVRDLRIAGVGGRRALRCGRRPGWACPPTCSRPRRRRDRRPLGRGSAQVRGTLGHRPLLSLACPGIRPWPAL
ncbi:transcriptional regulator [Streptomyces sp. NPDC048254]|uniref:transcriptional regulator n=1 Tax=Streptomyces sp. NPDC048254 TaxID=3365525 RepID=UPI00371C0D7C